MPAHPCNWTTAGNGPSPSARTSVALICSGAPGVTLVNATGVVVAAQAASASANAAVARRLVIFAMTGKHTHATVDGQLPGNRGRMRAWCGSDDGRAGRRAAPLPARLRGADERTPGGSRD